MAASCAWRAGEGYWWFCSPSTSDLDTKREHLLAKCVSPARKVRCGGWCGGWCGARNSCPVPCTGRWLDNMLATHAWLNQRKKTLEENSKTAGKTNGTEMTTGTKRIQSNSQVEQSQSENNLLIAR